MRRGTIVLTKFPFTDLSSVKRRPGIVVSQSVSGENDVIIAFISSVIPVNSEGTDYIIASTHIDFLETGLKKSSIIKLNKIATINSSLISGEIGSASAAIMKEVDARLKMALGL
ncbi:MAG: hypothetical protein K0Q79_1873 [Flavipsychrobacter sp.]|jgi:mRNA interferase MazF|nr:hypothetical protein [Flavipsychrobacter sp.]